MAIDRVLMVEADQLERRLEQSERRFRVLIEQVPDLILILNSQGVIQFCTPAVERILAYQPTEWVGRPGLEFVHPEDQLPLQSLLNSELAPGGNAIRIESRLRHHDGSWRAMELFVRNFLDDPALQGLVLHARDLTEPQRLAVERAQLEVQMRQQQKMEAIGTLASGVAHEINNPINGVMNYAQLILDAVPATSPLVEYAHEILRETERVATIVRNLLQFARQERESHSPANIADIIESTLSLLRAVLRHDQIDLSVYVPPRLPTVKCRTQQIQQVLMNLLTNARDSLNEKHPGYHPDKQIDVRVALRVGAAGRWLRVSVEDHGQGIPPALRDRVFDPFFTTKPRDRGTGLGLAISHGIVREHGGELHFESEPGQWTRFYLDLPVDNGWQTGSDQEMAST